MKTKAETEDKLFKKVKIEVRNVVQHCQMGRRRLGSRQRTS